MPIWAIVWFIFMNLINISQNLKKNALVKHSAVFFTGSMIASIMGYLYHLAMGRMLGPSNYAIVVSLLSLFTLISVPAGMLQTVIAKFTANAKADENFDYINVLQKYFSKSFFYVGCVIFAVLAIFSKPIAGFLRIDSYIPVLILGVVFFVVLIVPVFRGVLQGLQRFKALSLSLIADAMTKLGLGLLLVFMGLRVNGAITAIAMSAYVGILVTIFYLKDLKKFDKKVAIEKKKIFIYCIPVAVMLLTTALYYNIDIIMVKHYFDGTDAGHYSALSMLGKIIVFGTMSIVGVMFPMVAEAFRKGENYSKFLWQSVGIVALLSGIGIAAYFIFPHFIIGLLYGKEYQVVAPYLGYVGIFMGLYAIVNIFAQFFISIQKYTPLILLVIASILQIVALMIFHSSIKEVIVVMNIVMVSLLVAFLVYYLFTKSSYNPQNLNEFKK
ncbi:MAG: capsular polysaccharide biosynthesis protein [uncultured bacterium]|nr:MAG: capsular polysaccharide biosynthesis protein [uncultured bacterium]